MNERDKQVLIFGGIFAAILLFYLLFLRPLGQAVESADSKVQGRREAVAEMRTLTEELRVLRANLPQGSDNVNLLSYVEGLSRQADLKDHIEYMKPGSGVQLAGVRRSSVEVKLSRVNLKQLTNLLFQVERGGRVRLAVDEIHIKKRFDAPDLLDVTLEVYQG